jgi:glyoxylase-like metal-dependent hydrolase (beta-lactamase superfamily II)
MRNLMSSIQAHSSRAQSRGRRTSAPVAALLSGLALLSGFAAAGPADRFADVQVTAEPVNGSVYMLTGAGGNIGVSVGDDGTLIIDDQYAPLADRIQTALDGLGGGKPKLILNTHVHGDHTGGNAHFGTTGTIIAHDNVRIRLLEGDPDRSALPLVTYAERVTVHFNDESIELIHLPNGHTDGDSVVWFSTANVIHMGDHLFVDRFPYVDVGSGGTVRGFMRNLATVLEMVPDDAHVIPGHGPLTDTAAIDSSLTMIRATREIVAEAIAEGLDADAIIERGLGDEWASYGAGFINEERWIRILLSDFE